MSRSRLSPFTGLQVPARWWREAAGARPSTLTHAGSVVWRNDPKFVAIRRTRADVVSEWEVEGGGEKNKNNENKELHGILPPHIVLVFRFTLKHSLRNARMPAV